MKLRALVVSDHESEYIWDYFDASVFKGVDVIVSCGDLKAEYLSFLVTMIPAPLLYVRGNHDGRYEQNPPEGCIDLEENRLLSRAYGSLALADASAQKRRRTTTASAIWRGALNEQRVC